jgi:hypothetical protein
MRKEYVNRPCLPSPSSVHRDLPSGVISVVQTRSAVSIERSAHHPACWFYGSIRGRGGVLRENYICNCLANLDAGVVVFAGAVVL